MKGFEIVNNVPMFLEGDALLSARLSRLIFSPIGNVIGYDGIGSRVIEYFSNGATTETARSILNEIKTVIALYDKSLKIREVAVRLWSPDGQSSDEIEIQLEVEVDGVVKKISVTN